jgi:TetR/AcrR family transcriptional repressor of mexJK operon
MSDALAPSAAPARRRGRPPAGVAQERMRHVLRVARQAFVRDGYRATTMDDIAAAADVTKRSLYLWYADKAALFLACVLEGATRFPPLAIHPDEPVEHALKAYALALAREIASEHAYGMGALLLREGRDFPEVAAAVGRGEALLTQPLVAYLRKHRLEAPDSVSRAETLVAMILAEAHRALMMGAPAPDPEAVDRQALLAVEIFLNGAKA